MRKLTEETTIKHQVRDYLRWNGWFVWHSLQGLGSYPGVPDFGAAKHGKIYLIEIKKSDGVLSPKQIKFRDDLEAHGVTYYVFRCLEDAIEFNHSEG